MNSGVDSGVDPGANAEVDFGMDCDCGLAFGWNSEVNSGTTRETDDSGLDSRLVFNVSSELDSGLEF